MSKTIQKVRNVPEAPEPCQDTFLESEAALEGHEVFTLPPLSRKRATAKVLRIQPARFYHIADDLPSGINEE